MKPEGAHTARSGGRSPGCAFRRRARTFLRVRRGIRRSTARPIRDSRLLPNSCRRHRTKLRTSAKVETGDEPGLRPFSGKDHFSDHMILRRRGKAHRWRSAGPIVTNGKATSPPAVPRAFDTRAAGVVESMPGPRLSPCQPHEPVSPAHAGTQRSAGPPEDKMRYVLKILHCTPLPGTGRVATAAGIHAPGLRTVLRARRLRQELHGRSATFPLPVPPMRTFLPGKWPAEITE